MNQGSPARVLVLLGLVFSLCFACSTSSSHKHAPIAPGMVRILGGTFMMGCVSGDNLCEGDERPPHPVTLKSFDMDRTEVTVEDFGRCVNAGRCAEPNSHEPCNGGRAERNTHPINCVDWNQAKAYCEWAGKRLPSEAEWEYAARGGLSGRIYPWGNEPADCSRAVLDDERNGCGKYATWPAGSKAANGFGLYDMAGNVGEWCSDWYDAKAYSQTPSPDPQGASAGHYRVFRGGSWDDSPPYLRVSRRNRLNPDDWINDIGFRCARSVE